MVWGFVFVFKPNLRLCQLWCLIIHYKESIKLSCSEVSLLLLLIKTIRNNDSYLRPFPSQVWRQWWQAWQGRRAITFILGATLILSFFIALSWSVWGGGDEWLLKLLCKGEWNLQFRIAELSHAFIETCNATEWNIYHLVFRKLEELPKISKLWVMLWKVPNTWDDSEYGRKGDVLANSSSHSVNQNKWKQYTVLHKML